MRQWQEIQTVLLAVRTDLARRRKFHTAGVERRLPFSVDERIDAGDVAGRGAIGPRFGLGGAVRRVDECRHAMYAGRSSSVR
jgi:hypothetical protein